MYDTHIARINNRPGEAIQIVLHRRLIDKFLSKIEEMAGSSEILEVGPGSGRVAVEFISRGFRYVAIEPTSSMIRATNDRIQKSFSNRSKIEYYEEKLPKLNSNLIERFDSAVMIHTLEHAANPYEAHEWLDSIMRSLKPGGFVLVVSPDYCDYGSDFYDCDWSHSFPTTLMNVNEIMRDVGFGIVYSSGIRGWYSGVLPKSLLLVVRRLLPVRLINLIALKLLGHEKLGSGLASAFFYRNLFVVGKKPTLPTYDFE